jgi:xanthine/CO dehydrogenase XdhC/CoxF family maturation factor
LLVEAFVPPPRLFLFGTGHDAVPVAQLARQLGWDVYVCTSQARFSTRERFAMADEIVVATPAELAARIDAAFRAVVIVMHHDPARDRDALGLALSSRARHIVTLGPRPRVTDPRLRVLDLGGTPQQLALALIADAQIALDPRPLPGPPGSTDRPGASRTSQVLATAPAI